jgi:hypothetical protein
MERQAKLVLHLGGQPVPLAVVQMDIEGGEAPQHGEADPTGSEDAESASGSSCSKTDSGPSLSDVTTSV